MKSPYDLNNEKRTFVHGHPLATAVAPGFISGDEKTKLAGIEEGATANMADSALLDRTNHTGTQAISTVTGLQTELNNRQPADATLTAVAGASTVANSFIYFTATDVAAVSTITTFGRSLVDDVDSAAARTTLGLGTAATQPASAFQAAITQSTTAPPSPAVGDLWIDLSS